MRDVPSQHAGEKPSEEAAGQRGDLQQDGLNRAKRSGRPFAIKFIGPVATLLLPSSQLRIRELQQCAGGRTGMCSTAMIRCSRRLEDIRQSATHTPAEATPNHFEKSVRFRLAR